jgi:precorrin-6A synthase
LNRVGGAVWITTGRRLARALPLEADDVVVMLDGECAFNQVPAAEYDVYWSAYLGSEHELSIAGCLADCKEEIERVRAEARARHGWIMDIYLLRRRRADEPDALACRPGPKVG